MADPGLIWLDGFEVDRNLGAYYRTGAYGGSVQNTGRGGGYCFDTGGGGSNWPYFRLFLSTTYTEIFLGGAWYNKPYDMFKVLENNSTVHAKIYMDATGYIKAYRGDGTTLLGTSAIPVNYIGNWYYVETYLKVHDTLGEVIVKVNGQEFLNLTNQDTRNGGSGNFNEIWFGKANWDTGAEVWRLDDLYVADGTALGADFLGDLSVEALPVSGDDTVQFTPSTGTTNYAMVDETPFSASDYVSSSNTSHKDLYTVTNTAKPATYVPLAVRVVSSMGKTDGQTRKARVMVNDGGTESDGATRYLGYGSAAIYADIFGQRPGGAGDWTNATIDSLKVGVENVP